MDDKKENEEVQLVSAGAMDALMHSVALYLSNSPSADKEVAIETIKRKSNALMLGMVLLFIMMMFAMTQRQDIAINIMIGAFGFVGGFGVGRKTT